MRRMFTVVAALVAAACLVPSVATAQTLDERERCVAARDCQARNGQQPGSHHEPRELAQPALVLNHQDNVLRRASK